MRARLRAVLDVALGALGLAALVATWAIATFGGWVALAALVAWFLR